MKTASEELKSKNGVPVNANAVNTTVSQPGPEDGRDQNITPNSNTYDPSVIPAGSQTIMGEHNVEVHRTDENDSFKSADRK